MTNIMFLIYRGNNFCDFRDMSLKMLSAYSYQKLVLSLLKTYSYRNDFVHGLEMSIKCIYNDLKEGCFFNQYLRGQFNRTLCIARVL